MRNMKKISHFNENHFPSHTDNITNNQVTASNVKIQFIQLEIDFVVTKK